MCVCALYTPVEDVVISEDAVEEACNKLVQGMMEEFRKMDFYDTYEVVPNEPGMKLLDATWVNKRQVLRQEV